MKKLIILSLTLIFICAISTTVYAEEATESETTYPLGTWSEYNDGNECLITAYCLCRKCCGKNYKNNLTASGVAPLEEVTVANGKLPFGTLVYIEDIGFRLVQDRGSKVGATHFDVYLGVDKHSDTRQFGRKKKRVWIVE